MPELPDIETYLHCLTPRILERPLLQVRLRSPFLLRSVEPPLTAATGAGCAGCRRLGKRIVFGLEGELLPGHPPDDRRAAALAEGGRPSSPASSGWPPSTSPAARLLLTEAGTQEARLAARGAGRGGAARPTTPAGSRCCRAADLARFGAALTRENHTLKRALTDPRLLSGIGNAYSDEILHRAAPLARSS